MDLVQAASLIPRKLCPPPALGFEPDRLAKTVCPPDVLRYSESKGDPILWWPGFARIAEKDRTLGDVFGGVGE